MKKYHFFLLTQNPVIAQQISGSWSSASFFLSLAFIGRWTVGIRTKFWIFWKFAQNIASAKQIIWRYRVPNTLTLLARRVLSVMADNWRHIPCGVKAAEDALNKSAGIVFYFELLWLENGRRWDARPGSYYVRVPNDVWQEACNKRFVANRHGCNDKYVILKETRKIPGKSENIDAEDTDCSQPSYFPQVWYVIH